MVSKVPVLDGLGKLQEVHIPDRLSSTQLAEQIRDVMNAAFAAGTQTNVSITYNDAADSFSFNVTGGGGNVTVPAGSRMMLTQFSSNQADARVSSNTTLYSVFWVTSYANAPTNLVSDVDIWLAPAG